METENPPIRVLSHNKTAFRIAKDLWRRGWNINQIALEIGRKRDTVACWLNPKRRAYKRQYAKQYAHAYRERNVVPEDPRLPKGDLTIDKSATERADRRFIRMLNEAGPDTRDKTGIMHGDPLPHRSALHGYQPQEFGYKPRPIVPYEPEIRDDGQAITR